MQPPSAAVKYNNSGKEPYYYSLLVSETLCETLPICSKLGTNPSIRALIYWPHSACMPVTKWVYQTRTVRVAHTSPLFIRADGNIVISTRSLFCRLSPTIKFTPFSGQPNYNFRMLPGCVWQLLHRKHPLYLSQFALIFPRSSSYNFCIHLPCTRRACMFIADGVRWVGRHFVCKPIAVIHIHTPTLNAIATMCSVCSVEYVRVTRHSAGDSRMWCDQTKTKNHAHTHTSLRRTEQTWAPRTGFYDILMVSIKKHLWWMLLH